MEDIHKEFKFIKKLGKGSFSKVYLAIRRNSREKFAIKKLSKRKLLKDKDNFDMLWNEINIMRRLGDNEHTIKFLEVHETENAVYLVLEYLRGGNLKENILDNFMTLFRSK